MFHHFCNPLGFNYDVYSKDTDGVITYQNVLLKSNDLANYFKNERRYYDSNIIMHTMGDDF